MAKIELPCPILPFSRPLPDYEDFNNVRFRVYTLCRERRRRITIAEADRIADEHAVDERHHVAIASYLYDFNRAHGIPPRNKNPDKSNAAVEHAGLILEVCRKRDRRKPTMRELAAKYDVHEKSIPRFMRNAGYTKGTGGGGHWTRAGTTKAFMAKLAAHRARIKHNRARCAWVSPLEGVVDLEAICACGIGLQWKEPKVNDRYLGRVNGAYNCPSRWGYLAMGTTLWRNRAH